MSALLIGFLLVVTSAALFGVALFGRRPLPQPAIVGGHPHRGSGQAEIAPSRFSGGEITVARLTGVQSPVLIQAPEEPTRLSAADVRVPVSRRLRAATLLGVSVLGTAFLIGAVLSIVVVGAVLLLV